MAKTVCRTCASSFEVTDLDRKFLARFDVPEPTRCPTCRSRLRISTVNQIHLFKRSCDGTKKPIITHYPPESPCKVYDQAYWYSDAVDNSQFGRAVDFNRPFFDQFHELAQVVPRPALFTNYLKDENSAYTNYAGGNKNCYLIFDSDENWDCYYSYSIGRSRSSSDCYRVQNVELCYEAIDSVNCYQSMFLMNCDGCRDSAFLQNCIGCSNCFLCSNLHHKQYHVFNKPVSKEEYQRLISSLGSHSELEKHRATFEHFREGFPQKFMHGFKNENVHGDYLVECKNAQHCYDCTYLHDARYCTQTFMPLRDSIDTDECGEGELIYECNNLGLVAHNIRLSSQCIHSISDLTYCMLCMHGCEHLFGCFGLRRKKYCILNKEYSLEEYEALSARLTAHMRETGEWGEFFPEKLSPIPYNLSFASMHYPLDEQSARKLGYQWRPDDAREYQPASCDLPNGIHETTDAIASQILACAGCRKNYRITPQELAFHRQLGVALPRLCFHCRHNARLAQRNPRTLWQRSCSGCGIEIQTSYAPDRPEPVCCEKCYLESFS